VLQIVAAFAMSTPTAISDLRDALVAISGRASALGEQEAAQLQERVCAAVDELKANGAPAERVVVVIRALAREAGIGPVGHPLVELIIGWCVDRNYANNRAGQRSTAQ
jgi:hypothetical protein